MGKRKAEYGRAGRTPSQSRKKKAAASKAIESRWKRKIQDQSKPLTDLTNNVKTTSKLESRIIDLDNLGSGLKEISSHSSQCGGICVFEGESMHAGLATVLSIKCNKCQVNSALIHRSV